MAAAALGAMAGSVLLRYCPGLNRIPVSYRLIVVTLVVGFAAAVLAPVDDEDDPKEPEKASSAENGAAETQKASSAENGAAESQKALSSGNGDPGINKDETETGKRQAEGEES